MKLLKFSLALSLVFLLIWFSPAKGVKTVSADTDPCQQDSYDAGKCQDQINQYQQKLSDARNQENTLKSQLAIIDGQTKITTLKIEDTNAKIDKLQREITDLSGRITRISGTLDSLTSLLLNRIVQTYKYSSAITPIDLLFSSHGFADLLERVKYIQVAQAYDKKKLYELQATKLAYNDQKQDKQTRQAEAEKLAKQLDDYKKQLDDERKTKDALLRLTQNNEAVYQAKLQASLAEQQAILQLAGNAINEVADGPVHQGDIIATIIPDKSPCSSGAHLHFEVHKNNVVQDPNNFLSNISFSYWDNDGGADEGMISPHGSWPWPLSGSIIITQGYGMTPYAKITGAYGPQGHTGIDMWSGWGNLSVHAVHDGQLSHGGIACPAGGTLRYKRVDHGDGYSSYYLHVI